MIRLSRLIRSLDRLIWHWSLPRCPEIEAIDREIEQARRAHKPVRHLQRRKPEITHAKLRSAR